MNTPEEITKKIFELLTELKEMDFNVYCCTLDQLAKDYKVAKTTAVKLTEENLAHMITDVQEAFIGLLTNDSDINSNWWAKQTITVSDIINSKAITEKTRNAIRSMDDKSFSRIFGAIWIATKNSLASRVTDADTVNKED